MINIDIVAACTHGRMKHSPEQILLAMDGRLSAHDRQLIDIQMAMLDSFQKRLAELDTLIGE